MKNALRFILVIGLAICVVHQNTIAQDTQEWHLRGLPEGAKARFGRGTITGDFASSHDGKRLAVPCSIGIWIYNTETDKPLNLLTRNTGGVSSERRVQDRKYLWILTEDINGVLSVAFSPDDTLLASTNYDKTVRVWDVHTGIELWTMQGHKDKPTDVAFSPDGKLLASASEDNTVRLWDVETRESFHTLIDPNHNIVLSVAFSPDVELPLRLEGNVKTGPVSAPTPCYVAFSADGKKFVSANERGFIYFWDMQTGKRTNEITLDVKTDKPIKTRFVNQHVFTSVAFSPDGKTLRSVYIFLAVMSIAAK